VKSGFYQKAIQAFISKGDSGRALRNPIPIKCVSARRRTLCCTERIMLKKILTASVLTAFMGLGLGLGLASASAQEQPSTTPAPEAEQPPAAKADTPKADATKKSAPAHHRRVLYRRYEWPWTWVWYRLRYDFRHLRHR
jgi:hypothetical protein